MSDLVWQPDTAAVSRTRLTAFQHWVNSHHQLSIADYAGLHDWSVNEIEAFWSALWQFAEVRASQPATTVLQDADRMPGARWFVGARLNFAENLLRRRDNATALHFHAEDQCYRQWSWKQLYDEVSRVAQALRAAGVGVGDRVAGFVPNAPETLVAMLATSSLGAVWSSCSPDFGVQGVLDRFGQIEPKVLFTSDGYFYNGKRLNSLEKIAGIVEQLPCIQQVVVWPLLNAEVEQDPTFAQVPRVVSWAGFTAAHPAADIDFVQLPFDHPLYILYSSGTTGKPKCIVHGAGGTLLQHLKEHILHGDLHTGDRLMYYTTCGWMMWNWMASALAVGATLVLYDGSPFAPEPGILWRIAEQHQLTHFGTSAKYLSALEKHDCKPGQQFDLSALRFVFSTGSPLLPESYDYVYRDIKAEVALCSISGGTDIVSCFALGAPTLPVYRGELQARGLGMAVQIWNDAGQPVVCEKGELVCTKPFPSMPVGFWNDADGSRYRAAYFERFPNVWVHGDYAELTPRGGLIIYGRSDAVLNPGGVRIGTAEIYRQVETIPEVVESLCIGQDWEGDVRVVLFVRLREGGGLDEALQKLIRDRIRQNTTPRHVPARIVAVADIPRTLSGKIVELAVRNVVHGRPVTNREALANPQALELFRDLPELQS
ncbi:acetoacetate--CoA ligase [Leeia sp.]|uniref:acetoacetate--CoA ligase n=1 Tax=Leeia sp. TaxID=2884678 RepID=UPI0035B15C45